MHLLVEQPCPRGVSNPPPQTTVEQPSRLGALEAWGTDKDLSMEIILKRNSGKGGQGAYRKILVERSRNLYLNIMKIALKKLT